MSALEVPTELLPELQSLYMLKGTAALCVRLQALFPNAEEAQLFDTYFEVRRTAWEVWKHRIVKDGL